MSIGKSWEIQTGLGEEILRDIGEVVRERKELGPPTEDLEFLAAVHYQSASLLVARRLPDVAAGLNGPDAEAVDVRLSPDEYDQYLKALRMETLINRARNLGDTTYLDNSHMWRVRIEPFLSGAVELAVTGGGGSSGVKKSRMLEVGETIEGKSGVIGAIKASPSVGGEVIFDFPGEERPLPRRQGVHVTGLVSPDTGEEQASLEILARE